MTETNVKNGPDIVIPKITTAVEVELGSSNMKFNLQNNIQKFNKVIVCSDQKKLLETLSSENKSQNVLFLQIRNVPGFFDKMQTRNELVNK